MIFFIESILDIPLFFHLHHPASASSPGLHRAFVYVHGLCINEYEFFG